jgi:hypothetical protein
MASESSTTAPNTPEKPQKKKKKSWIPHVDAVKAQGRTPDAFDRTIMTWQAVRYGFSKAGSGLFHAGSSISHAGSSLAKFARRVKNKRDGVPAESHPDPRLEGKGKREWVFCFGSVRFGSVRFGSELFCCGACCWWFADG